MDDDYEYPKRPWSVWLIGLWSLARAISPILAIVGSIRLQKLYLGPSLSLSVNANLPDWIRDVLLYWIEGTVAIKLSIIFAIISAVAFFYISIGLFLGHSWARSAFLITSSVLVIWNLRLVFQPKLEPFLASTAALLFASWYFRQPPIEDYYGGGGGGPRFLAKRFFTVPIDLEIALLIWAILGLIEVAGLIRMY